MPKYTYSDKKNINSYFIHKFIRTQTSNYLHTAEVFRDIILQDRLKIDIKSDKNNM